MKVVLQRCLESSVEVDSKIVGKINKGLIILVGFTQDDNIDDINYIVDKVINLRIFDDQQSVMNKSLLDIKGEILSVSQFTLYADTKKGRRPSYIKALNGNDAKKLYNIFNQKLRDNSIIVNEGIFGADMKVSIVNDGPVTIVMESRN